MIENFNQLFVCLCLFNTLGHQIAEFEEVNFSAVVLIGISHHFGDFLFSGVLAEGAHNGAQLLDRDALVVVHVEHLEDAPEVLNLLLSQVFAQRVQLGGRDPVLLIHILLIGPLVVCPLPFRAHSTVCHNNLLFLFY